MSDLSAAVRTVIEALYELDPNIAVAWLDEVEDDPVRASDVIESKPGGRSIR